MWTLLLGHTLMESTRKPGREMRGLLPLSLHCERITLGILLQKREEGFAVVFVVIHSEWAERGYYQAGNAKTLVLLTAACLRVCFVEWVTVDVSLDSNLTGTSLCHYFILRNACVSNLTINILYARTTGKIQKHSKHTLFYIIVHI